MNNMQNNEDRFPWDVYNEETKDVNKHPKEFKDAVWYLNDKPIKEDSCMAVFKDKYPCKEGHLLYVPKTRDAPGMVGLCFQEAYRDGMQMVNEGKIEGFNLGMNQGESAGQSIFWPHIHFIPRISGDQEGRARGIRLSYPPDQYDPSNLGKEKK